MDKETLQGKSQQTQSDASGKEHQGWSTVKRDSATDRIVFIPGDGRTIDEHPGWEAPYETLYITPQGKIYGFVGVDGRIYLDETIIKPEHPIHEYTHLWDRVIAQKNPELWKRGIALMKKTSLWEKYANHDQYGKKWKAIKGITPGRKGARPLCAIKQPDMIM